jgi:lactoylglutathione lyase
VYTADCDAVVERLRAAGVTVTEEPVDQPWGERVARVLDPDGNEVIIGARARSDAPEGA